MFSTVTQSNHIPYTSTKIGQDRGIPTRPAVEISHFKKIQTTAILKNQKYSINKHY